MDNIIEKIKNLSEEQLIAIAKILVPEIEWQVNISENKWDGHDLIEKGHNPKTFQKWIVQVDYREHFDGSSVPIELKQRFRSYENLYVCTSGAGELKKILDIIK